MYSLANSEDPDEIPHIVVFHQGLHHSTFREIKSFYMRFKTRLELSQLFIPRRSRRDIVLASSVRPSVCPSVRPSIPSVRPSGTISQYLLVRFDSFLVQMISTMDSQTSNKFGQNQPLNT